MLGYEKEQRNLTKEQRQAVGLLSVGTLLEYFDLMLYVHMSVLLNELFFPKADTYATSLYSIAALCATFIFRPLGALVFGYLGDTYGRKTTVVITTMMMATSCIVIALLPTYNEIGITASIIIILCRIAQGMSSMGEVIGTEVYLTEFTKPPIQYPIVALATVFATVGTFAALGIATIVTSYGFNWRYAFGIGAIIAVVGTIARTALRETPEFANAKLKLLKTFEKANRDIKVLENNPIWKEKIDKKTAIALFIMDCAWPVCFYFAYIYCGDILIAKFNYTPDEVIKQNFKLSIVELISIITVVALSYRIYPLKILKVLLSIFTITVLLCPYLLNKASNSNQIFIIQSLIMAFALNVMPAVPNCFRHFPIFKRFTSVTFTYALSAACMYVISSFGFPYLINTFGNWGLLIIMIPTSIGFGFGIFHFERLEKESGNYPTKPFVTSSPGIPS
ncbi:MFS transporter [Rickettsia endosymbiont of Cantharis rufa]|uniref:MFS transporter n=1 Tax=Rickettsia endosymbiont of Cantharis rufa TaxID=3066248 RepID=UPI0031334219